MNHQIRTTCVSPQVVFAQRLSSKLLMTLDRRGPASPRSVSAAGRPVAPIHRASGRRCNGRPAVIAISHAQLLPAGIARRGRPTTVGAQGAARPFRRQFAAEISPHRIKIQPRIKPRWRWSVNERQAGEDQGRSADDAGLAGRLRALRPRSVAGAMGWSGCEQRRHFLSRIRSGR
jgi:hypothetical protein